MPVKVNCPSCTAGLKIARRMIGQPIFCPKCGRSIVATGEGSAHCDGSRPAAIAAASRPTRSLRNLFVLLLILLAFPGGWIAALHHRAERNEQILLARANAQQASPPKLQPLPVPAVSEPAPIIEPKLEPIDAPPTPMTEQKPVIEEPKSPSVTNPIPEPPPVVRPKLPPKVNPIPQPPVLAKIDPPKLKPKTPEPKPEPKVEPKPEKTAAELRVDAIVDEIRRFPAASNASNRQLQTMLGEALPRYGDELEEYRDDGFNPFKLKADNFDRLKTEYPLRVLAFEISSRLAKASQLPLRDTVTSPIDGKIKSRILGEQKGPALMILSLQELLEDAQAAAAQRENEKSKRWRAHFDLAMARLQARLLYLYEHDNLLAAIRTDSLPALEGNQKGWQATPCVKVQTKETTVKDLAKQLTKNWDRIAKEYASTPWAFVAEREKDAPLGLEWTAMKR